MPIATVRKLAEKLPNLQLFNCYGSTETTSPSTITPLGEVEAFLEKSLSGVTVLAWEADDAYLLALKGKPDVVIGGLSGEQRFFLAFAQRWRKAQTEYALRRQIKTDTHAPGEYRSDTVRNVDGWYDVYKVAPDDKLYLKAEDRVRIW